MISSGVLRRIPVLFLLVSMALASVGCRTWSGREERAASAYNRGNSLREAGRGEEAISAYREALNEAPEFHAATFNLALTLVENGSPREGLEYLESLRVLDPVNLTILRAMGWAAWMAGDYELSLAYYKSVLGIFPADIPSRHGKSDMLDSAGRFEEAADVRRELLVLEDTPENRLNLATSLRNAGLHKQALVEYREILVAEPENLIALVGASLSAGASGLPTEELGYRRRAVAVKGDDAAEHWWEIARLLLVEFASFEEGLEALQNALDAGFDDSEAEIELLAETPPAIRPAVRDALSDSSG